MTTRFIKLTQGPDSEYHVNPTFIISIRKIAGNKAVVYTMDGNSIYPNETVEEIMDKIKKAEAFYISFDNK